jgi:hypothetical protein
MGIHFDLILSNESAEACDLGYIGNGGELVSYKMILQGAELTQVNG